MEKIQVMFSEDEVYVALQKKVSEYDGSQSQLARDWGYKPSYISDVLSRRRPVSARLAKNIGFHELPRRFVRNGSTSAQR